MTEEGIAAELTAAKDRMNKALETASDAGVVVTVDVIDITNLSSKAPCLRVNLKAERHTREGAL